MSLHSAHKRGPRITNLVPTTPNFNAGSDDCAALPCARAANSTQSRDSATLHTHHNHLPQSLLKLSDCAAPFCLRTASPTQPINEPSRATVAPFTHSPEPPLAIVHPPACSVPFATQRAMHLIGCKSVRYAFTPQCNRQQIRHQQRHAQQLQHQFRQQGHHNKHGRRLAAWPPLNKRPIARPDDRLNATRRLPYTAGTAGNVPTVLCIIGRRTLMCTSTRMINQPIADHLATMQQETGKQPHATQCSYGWVMCSSHLSAA